MAKKSSIEKNNRRRKLSKKYSSRRARLRAIALAGAHDILAAVEFALQLHHGLAELFVEIIVVGLDFGAELGVDPARLAGGDPQAGGNAAQRLGDAHSQSL